MTTATSSLSSVGLAALFDELEKIAADQEKKQSKWKSRAKNIGLTALGAGAATGASMLADHYLTPKLSPGWRALHPVTRNMIGAAVIGGGSLAAGALAKKLYEERKRTEE